MFLYPILLKRNSLTRGTKRPEFKMTSWLAVLYILDLSYHIFPTLSRETIPLNVPRGFLRWAWLLLLCVRPGYYCCELGLVIIVVR